MRKYLSMVAILSFSGLNAGEFQSLGGNSMGMGGAGVASASGSLAGYYNPALLTQKKGVEGLKSSPKSIPTLLVSF